MDIFKTPQTLISTAVHTSTKLSKQLLCVLVLPGVFLCLALQIDSTNPSSADNPDRLVPTANPLTSVEQPVSISSDTVITVSTDRLPGKINRTKNAVLPFATSMSGARVALSSFTTPSTIDTKTETTETTAKIKYQFNQTLKQSLFTAVVSSPFAVGFDDDAKLAIWQINPHFALVDKVHKFVIMLDPGHGGTDPGSVGHNGLQEKILTLDIAKRAKRLLSKNKNISVVLTRNSDNGMSRKSRVHKVKKSKADMFVSIHLNHLPQTDVNLVETFYAAPRNILESIDKQRAEKSRSGMVETNATLNPNLSFTLGSRQLASIMQKRVFDEVIDNNPETDNAGVKEDTLYILTRSFTPGALIELSCLSNVKEAERLNNPAYREKLAAALAKGIQEYLDTPAAKHQFGPKV